MAKSYEYGIDKEYTPDEVQSLGGTSAFGNDKSVITLFVVKGSDGTNYGAKAVGGDTTHLKPLTHAEMDKLHVSKTGEFDVSKDMASGEIVSADPKLTVVKDRKKQ